MLARAKWSRCNPRYGAARLGFRRGRTATRLACMPSSPGLDFHGERILRACLARNILHRLAEAPTGSCLAHLGILPLRCPPSPPAFPRFESDLVSYLAALRLRPPPQPGGHGGGVDGAAAPPAGYGTAAAAAPAAAEAATAEVLGRHLGPPTPYKGYTTSSGKQCRLAPGDTVRRLRDPSLEAFFLSLFRCIEEQRAPMVTLGPHCLFHAHLFAAEPPSIGPDPGPGLGPDPGPGLGLGLGLGLLFHACEYPAFHEKDFPFRLGHCQEGSPLRPTGRQLAQRNMLWFKDRLVVLDVTPGLLLQHLLWKETAELCTLYEEDFGAPVLDLTLDVAGGPEGVMTTAQSLLVCQR